LAVGDGQFVNNCSSYYNPLVAVFTPPQRTERLNMKNKTSSPPGFTLVEIMIVVAIIGMLATLAIPNYVKSREQAYKTGCLNNLRQIDSAIQSWALELKKDAGQGVTFEDIKDYLRNSVVCPSGGQSFADSYTIKTVDARPTCQRRPDTHRLPL
jgi:prepilin-type N-terminal cleavage/methylation domain-containing protein